MRIVFFADTHLSKNNSQRKETVRTFLRDVCTDSDSVIILGDLFEFYHGYDGYIYPWYREIAEVLKEITEGGKAVYLVEGNHEFGMGAFFQSYTGVTCVEELKMDLEGKRLFVSHGDGMGSSLLRKILKSRFTYLLMDFFGPELSWRIAMGCAIFLSRKKKGQSKRIRDRYRKYAREKLKEGYDAVILAHSHISDLVQLECGGKKKTYLNPGDLVEYLTYGEYSTSHGFEIKSYRR